LLGGYRRIAPVAGKNLHLTIDMELQEIVDEAAEERVSGGIVVLDPRDGSILAMFSKPGFNPNAWSGRLSTQEQRESDNNPFHPMLDKSVQSWFPGSTYKVITAIAALEEGLITAEDTINCPGYLQYGDRRFRCWNRGGHGDTNLRSALAESCDVYFYQLGLQLGIDRMASYAYEFGLGERPGLGFNGDSPGVVPTREWHEQHSPGGFQYGFTVNTSVGQGDTRVSPLQLALAYAALLNGGTLYYPRIVDRITAADGQVVFEYPRRVRRMLPFSELHRGEVIEGLRAVVHDEQGTVFSHRLPYMNVVGKTGTAQVRSLESVRLADGEIVFRDRDHGVIMRLWETGGLGKPGEQVFDSAEKPLLWEVAAQGIIDGGKSGWDNIHIWGFHPDGIVSTPGMPYGMHLHWRWSAALTDKTSMFLGGWMPDRFRAPELAGRDLSGAVVAGGPLIDPRNPVTDLRIAVVTKATAEAFAQKTAASHDDFVDMFRDIRNTPAGIEGGDELVVIISIVVHRQDRSTRWKGTVFPHGLFYPHVYDIGYIGENALTQAGAYEPQYLRTKPSTPGWMRDPR
jgi:hypothetical protein